MCACRTIYQTQASLKVFDCQENLQLSRNLYCLFKRYLEYRKHLALGRIIANLYIILMFCSEN